MPPIPRPMTQRRKILSPRATRVKLGVLEQGGGGPGDVVLIFNQSPQDARGEGLFSDGIRSGAGKVAATEEDRLTRERGEAVFHHLRQSLAAITHRGQKAVELGIDSHHLRDVLSSRHFDLKERMDHRGE